MTDAGRERVRTYGPTVGIMALLVSVLAFGFPIVRSAGNVEHSVAINAATIEKNDTKIEALRSTTTDLLVATAQLLEITRGTQADTAEFKSDLADLRTRVRALESKR